MHPQGRSLNLWIPKIGEKIRVLKIGDRHVRGPDQTTWRTSPFFIEVWCFNMCVWSGRTSHCSRHREWSSTVRVYIPHYKDVLLRSWMTILVTATFHHNICAFLTSLRVLIPGPFFRAKTSVSSVLGRSDFDIKGSTSTGEPAKKKHRPYFQWTTGCLTTGSLFLGLWNIPHIIG